MILTSLAAARIPTSASQNIGPGTWGVARGRSHGVDPPGSASALYCLGPISPVAVPSLTSTATWVRPPFHCPLSFQPTHPSLYSLNLPYHLPEGPASAQKSAIPAVSIPQSTGQTRPLPSCMPTMPTVERTRPPDPTRPSTRSDHHCPCLILSHPQSILRYSSARTTSSTGHSSS